MLNREQGIALPNAFPAEIYHSIAERISTRSFSNTFIHAEWHFAWNCVANRFMIAVECRDNFSRLLKDARSHQVRYFQEKELFLFYCAAVSCIDSLCYSILALIDRIEPSLANFKSESTKRKNTPELLLTELMLVLPDDHLTRTIKRLLESSEYQDIRSKRAILFHRHLPGRIVGREHEAWMLDDAPIDEHLLGDKVNFLSKKLHTIFEALNGLVATKSFGTQQSI